MYMNVFEPNDSDNSDNSDNLIDEFNSYINIEDTKDKYKTIKKSYNVIINSKDRLLTNDGDTNYNFSVNFNSINTNSLNIGKNFKNINSIQFLGMVIPNIYLDINEVLGLYNKGLINSTTIPKKMMRISDLPYLLLHINEIKNNSNYGSNNQFNKSTFVLILDDTNNKTNNNSGNYTISGPDFSEHGNINNTILASTDKRVLYLKDITGHPIQYYSSPYSYLSNLRISITTPEGQILSNLNNYLECSSIKGNGGTPTAMIVAFTKYFCADEYNIGDKIIFKDIVMTNNGPLQNFLMKNEGHSIVSITKSSGIGTGTTKLYNEITIPYEYTIDMSTTTNTTGNSSIVNTFGLDNTGGGTVTFTGKVLNVSLQTTFALNIMNEERDEPKLHGNII